MAIVIIANSWTSNRSFAAATTTESTLAQSDPYQPCPGYYLCSSIVSNVAGLSLKIAGSSPAWRSHAPSSYSSLRS